MATSPAYLASLRKAAPFLPKIFTNTTRSGSDRSFCSWPGDSKIQHCLPFMRRPWSLWLDISNRLPGIFWVPDQHLHPQLEFSLGDSAYMKNEPVQSPPRNTRLPFRRYESRGCYCQHCQELFCVLLHCFYLDLNRSPIHQFSQLIPRYCEICHRFASCTS